MILRQIGSAKTTNAVSMAERQAKWNAGDRLGRGDQQLVLKGSSPRRWISRTTVIPSIPRPRLMGESSSGGMLDSNMSRTGPTSSDDGVTIADHRSYGASDWSARGAGRKYARTNCAIENKQTLVTSGPVTISNEIDPWNEGKNVNLRAVFESLGSSCVRPAES